MDECGSVLVTVNDVCASHGFDSQGIERNQNSSAVPWPRCPQEDARRAFASAVFQIGAEFFIQVGGEFGGIVMGRGVSYRKGFVGQVGGLKEEAQALDHAGAQLGVADKAEMGCFINIFSRFLLDGFHLEIVRAFDAPGPRQVVIVRRIGGECPTFFLFRDEIPVFPGELGEGNGDGLAAGTFQHGFLAVQPDEFCFQFFPLEVGPGAPLCKGGKEKGEQSSHRQAEACGLFHQG